MKLPNLSALFAPLWARLAAGAGLLLVVAVVSLWFALRQEHRRVLQAQVERDQARAAAVVEAGRTQLQAEAARAAGAAQSRALAITLKSERAADAVRSEPGAQTPLPPGVRSALLDAIGGLRREAVAAADREPDHPGRSEPARAVPAP